MSPYGVRQHPGTGGILEVETNRHLSWRSAPGPGFPPRPPLTEGEFTMSAKQEFLPTAAREASPPGPFDAEAWSNEQEARTLRTLELQADPTNVQYLAPGHGSSILHGGDLFVGLGNFDFFKQGKPGAP